MTTVFHNVLCNLLYNKHQICRLCFLPIEGGDVRIHDKVVWEEDSIEDMYEILSFILGSNPISHLTETDPVCDQCSRSAISCYKFIKMCHENSQRLINAIEGLSNINIKDENKNTKTLFCAFHLSESSIKQYYDARRSVRTPSAALKRFQMCINNSWVNRVEKFEKLGKESNSQSDCKIKDENTLDSGSTSETNLEMEQICTILKDENSSEKFLCNKCMKTTTTFSDMQHHYKKQHCETPQNTTIKDIFFGACEECGKHLKTKQALTIHVKSHMTPISQKQNKTKFYGICSECGKKFSNKYTLKKHEMLHKKDLSVCLKCKKKFKSEYLYKIHECNLERFMPPQKYICDNCGKRFCHLRNLSTHIKYDHGSGKPLKCAFCPAAFIQKSALKNHMIKHTGEKNFECKICGGKFVTKLSLVCHTRRHTGEKPYKCKSCDKMFLSASRRADHFRSTHIAPSLKCGMCPSVFKNYGGLAKHKRRHYNPQSNLYLPELVKDVES